MIAPSCTHDDKRKYGTDRKGRQRHKCCLCGAVVTEAEPNLLGGMYLSLERAEQILNMLVEGSSVRATARVTNTSQETILKLLVFVGQRCKRYMDKRFRDITVTRAQADEVWQYVYCKNKTANQKGYGLEVGDSYCFTALDSDTKLLFAWYLGKRSGFDADIFCRKLLVAVKGRFQLSTDAFTGYHGAVWRQLGGHVDYGQVVKTFAAETKDDQRRYSPAKIIDCERRVIYGNPDYNKISTSHCERFNLSMRTCIRRMARLGNGFSKKWANHEAAVALFICHYNFCRIHGTLKTTPAVKHGLETAPWTMREMLATIAED